MRKEAVAAMYHESFKFSDADLDFLVASAAPEIRDTQRLRQILEEDEDFRNAFIGDEKTFQKVMSYHEIFLKISPKLYFEILLRRAHRELRTLGHTVERSGTQKIAVFDTGEVVDLLSRSAVLVYLADMLSSFTRIESYAVSFRSEKGIWRKIRFNDLDVDSLTRFSQHVDEQYRLAFFKRIADICLFMLGIFADYIQYTYRYPHSGELRPSLVRQMRRSTEEYEEKGKKFYKLAANHPFAKDLEISELFWLFHGSFHTAQKPLRHIAQNYLHNVRGKLFGLNVP
ncbi:MAG: hypothetical protein WBG50_27260 [Desulfomonilaceae bacterium]